MFQQMMAQKASGRATEKPPVAEEDGKEKQSPEQRV